MYNTQDDERRRYDEQRREQQRREDEQRQERQRRDDEQRRLNEEAHWRKKTRRGSRTSGCGAKT